MNQHVNAIAGGPGFPKPVAEIVGTLIEIFSYQKRTEVVELLESSSASVDDINYDNWNGGITTLHHGT
jgi:hypothetical protein